jgi:hypothetical protein
MWTVSTPPKLIRSESGFLLNWREIDQWALCNSPAWRVIREQMDGRSETEITILLAAHYLTEAHRLGDELIRLHKEGRVLFQLQKTQ